MKLSFPVLPRHIHSLIACFPPGTRRGDYTLDEELGQAIVWVNVTPALARKMLEPQNMFPLQRLEDGNRVITLEKAHENGLFLNCNVIQQAVQMTPKGDLIVEHNINGRHTLKFISRMPEGSFIRMPIRYYISSSADYTAELYAKIDIGKPRGQNDANRSVQLYKQVGFNDDEQSVLTLCNNATSAAVYLSCGFRLGRRDVAVQAATHDHKISLVIGHDQELRRFHALTAELRERLRDKSKTRDLTKVDERKRLTKVHLGLVRAPVLAAVLVGLRCQEVAMVAFLDAILRICLDGRTSGTVSGRKDANRQDAAFKAVEWLQEPPVDYQADKRAVYSALFAEIYLAHRDGTKLGTLKGAAAAVTAERIDAAWTKLTGSPFDPADLPLGKRQPEVQPEAPKTKSRSNVKRIRIETAPSTFPIELERSITRQRRRPNPHPT